MAFVSTFTSEKNQLQFGKKWKFFEFFLHPFICPIIPERKKVDVIFTFTHSLLNPRTNYETMDSVFVLGPDIQDTDIQARVKKNWEIFSKKSSIFSRKTKASYLMTKTWLVQKSPHPCYLSWGRMVSVSFVSVEKYELQMRKNFSTFFSSIFLPKKPSLKKILTPILSENVAYETLVNYTKPWTLYLVLVLRNRGSNIKNSQK